MAFEDLSLYTQVDPGSKIDVVFQVEIDGLQNEPAIGNSLSTPSESGFLIVDYVLNSGAWGGGTSGDTATLWIKKAGDITCGWLDNEDVTNDTAVNTVAGGVGLGVNGTPAGDRLTWGNVSTGATYAYLDKGIDFFNGSFAQNLTIEVKSTTVNGGVVAHWTMANDLGGFTPLTSANKSLFYITTNKVNAPAPLWRLYLQEVDSGGVYQTAVYGINPDTKYYLTVVRDENTGTYGTLTMTVYSDEARTVLLATRALTLHTSKKDFQYIYACQGSNNPFAQTHTGFTEDLDLDVTGSPTVTASLCTAITETTATGNGNITDIGLAPVTQHGHVWSETLNPTIADSKTEEGAAGVGAFTSAMTLLTRGKKYFVRAYATNGLGTGYSANITLYTDPAGIVQMAFGQSIFTEAPTFTDVSEYVMSLMIKRGRTHDLDRVEAGTAIVVVKNLDGDWWRYNTAGAYYPDVKPLTLVRISAVWNGTTYRRFYGVLESIRHSWIDNPGGQIPIATISCVDIFKSFSRLKAQSLPGTVGAFTNTVALKSNAAAAQKDVVIKSLGDSATEGCDIKFLHIGQTVTIGDTGNTEINEIASIDEDTYTLTMTTNLANAYTTANSAYVKKFPAGLTGVRVNDILSEFDWPSSLRDINTGQLTIAEYVPETGGEPGLEHLFAVVESEGGVIFIAGVGKVVFQDRDARLSSVANAITCDGVTTIALNTPQAIFSDDGVNQKYVTTDPEDDDTFIYNEARINGDAITEQIYRDVTAQDDQGSRPLKRASSLLNVNADAFDQAYTIVNRYNDSVLRIPSMTVIPDADPSNLFPKVLLYDLSTRINFELDQSPNIAELDKDYHIEGILDTLKVGSPWTTKWQLWDVNLYRIIQAEHDGYLFKEDVVSYANAHDAANADTALDDDTIIAVGQFNDGAADWHIWRGFLQFVTSSIGAAATIAKAEIILDITGLFIIDNAFDITVVDPQGITNPLAVADYGTLLTSTTSWGSVTISTSAVNKKVIIITLNATGIAAINKTGTTYFGLRSSRDISDTAPGNNESEYVTLEGVGSNAVPRLVVELNEVT